jgi:hypothetical protein
MQNISGDLSMTKLCPVVPATVLGIFILLGPVRAATGTITASPNPCNPAPATKICTANISWSTQGVKHARVFVRAIGNKLFPEKEFGTGPSCSRCEANWIEPGTEYVFLLVDFSNGTRGAELATVTVTAGGGAAATAPAGGAVTGNISASPNPCRLAAGQKVCTTYVTWSTQGAQHARVYVTAVGKTPEKEFGTGRSCEPGKCVANWIEAGAEYVFSLVDWSAGARGRELARAIVTAR